MANSKEKIIINNVARDLGIKIGQVKNTVSLIDEGNTIPFIARYRKEATGGLDEVQLRDIEESVNYQRKLASRKDEVLRLIEAQNKLTESLAKKIKDAINLQEVDDLYRPYRQKRKTRAVKAREKGLGPLAELMLAQKQIDIQTDKLAAQFLSKENNLLKLEDVWSGAQDIIAEVIADHAEIRKELRELFWKKGSIISEVTQKSKDETGKYKMYYDFQEAVRLIPPHRILALNRGENEDVLRIKVSVDETTAYQIIVEKIELTDSIFKEKIREAIEDSFKRLIAPSLEREIRSKLKDQAEEKAIEIFSTNLRALLLQSPLSGQIVMAIDPGFRTGSKVCVVDEIGNLLETNTIYPHPPQNNRESSARTIAHLVKKYEVDIIAVGNGTASRETEFFLADLIKNGLPTKYTIVDEAGASVYSASKIARNEFPELDVAMRGAISIARRLQDPLAELVKIEPRSIGVGMYQHDISQSQLTESLAGVVESVVNYVGVDLNTASRSLLEYVSGIKSSVASKIVAYREKNGRFATREQLRKVYGLGPKTFEQSAGFLRINSRKDPLASTPIHPESYFAAVNLLALYNFKESDILKQDKIKQIREKLSQIDIEKESNRLDIGKLTLEDIVESLKRPGRDPREQLPGPVFRTDVLKIDDLQTGMLFKGKVRNVVDFGAFIDIGLKQDGLVHISEMSTSYVNDPLAIVNVGETVEVKVIDIDEKRGRIGLSMKF